MMLLLLAATNWWIKLLLKSNNPLIFNYFKTHQTLKLFNIFNQLRLYFTANTLTHSAVQILFYFD